MKTEPEKTMDQDKNMPNDRVIAVTGGTGTVGGELLRLLSARGAKVRALSRHPGKAPRLPGVEWVAGDLADKESLGRFMSGAESMFLLTGNMENMVPAQLNAIDAAKQAGVRRVVKLSALGASIHSTSVIGLWHYLVEQALERSGMAWTLLRPHAYLQNFLGQAEDIRKGSLPSAAGDGLVPFVDARDIAEVAAEVLIRGGWEGKKLVLTGPAGRSHDEVAKVLTVELGYPVRHQRESEDEAWARLRGKGIPVWLAAGTLALYAYWRHGGATAKVSGVIEQVTGRPPRSLEEFVRDYKQQFAR